MDIFWLSDIRYSNEYIFAPQSYADAKARSFLATRVTQKPAPARKLTRKLKLGDPRLREIGQTPRGGA